MEGSTLLKSTRKPSAIFQKYTRVPFCFKVLCVIFCTGILMYIYVVRKTPYLTQHQIVTSYPSSKSQPVRTVLFWNSFFNDIRWGLPNDTVGPEWFRAEINCPVYHCLMTNKRDLLSDVEAYDAIVFHTSRMFPIFNSVPAKRNARQLYVFALMEPPGLTAHFLSDEGGFYNLTMTYRLDSDVKWPYHYLSDMESGEIVAPARNIKWRIPPSEWNNTEVWSLWANKTKTAAWFVSNCYSRSKREKLVKALQKFIDVDIYGKCGPSSCRLSSKECDDVLDHSYKFYLSFENSLCTDYVTEKLTRALNRLVVPVVFGGADYSRFVPPHSYINADDFESAQQLAAYLIHLSTHPEEYMRYFWWRRYYKTSWISKFCQLCEILHEPAFLHKRQNYQNIEQWWRGGICRSKARIKF